MNRARSSFLLKIGCLLSLYELRFEPRRCFCMARNKHVTVRMTEDELEWLQVIAPDGNVAKYIRDTVLRMSQSDRKLVNLDDRVVDIGHNVTRIIDLMHEQLRTQAKAAIQTSQEPGGIPEELVGMILEMLLLVRSFSSPQDRKMAQADVTQIGLPIWRKANLRDH